MYATQDSMTASRPYDIHRLLAPQQSHSLLAWAPAQRMLVVALISIVPCALGSIFANQPLRRDTTDICAYVDAELRVFNTPLGILSMIV